MNIKKAPLLGDDGFDDSLRQPLQPVSLEDRAYQRIEAIILSGRLKGGERLNDSKLAQAFSISRGPVRNALARLAEGGLVELIPYRGAFVRKIDLGDVLEIYEVRAAVERAGILAAGRNMTPEVLSQLKDLVDSMDAAVQKDDKEAYFPLNLAFHQLIHKASGNSRLIELYERYTREQKLFRHFSLTTVGLAESHQQHLRIINALIDGDVARAGQEMEDHVLSARDRLEQSVKRIKEEPDDIVL